MRGKFLTAIGVMWITLACGPVAQAATRAVPSDYSTIQSALKAARSGDRVEISPGTYSVNNLVLPQGVSLIGTGSRPNYTVLNGGGNGRILLCEGVDESSLIRNLTFTQGHAKGATSYDCSGGAILISNGSPVVEDCLFVDNSADHHGGAIRSSHASPILRNCLFLDNGAGEGGGGLDCSYDSSPQLTDCMFIGNSAGWGGALSCRGDSAPTVERTGFDANTAVGAYGYGGAVFADWQATPEFTSCTFYNNRADYGGAIACFENSQTNLDRCTLVLNEASTLGDGLLSSTASPVIRNTIIAFHDGTGVTSAGDRNPSIACSNLFGNTGGNWVSDISIVAKAADNLSTDPLFCNRTPGVDFAFYLDEDSPCAAENNGCSQIGAWPVGCQLLPQSLSVFTAAWEDGVPRLDWRIPIPSGDYVFKLARVSSNNPGIETIIPYSDLGNGVYTAVDEELALAKALEYTYRVFLVTSTGREVQMGEAKLSNAPIVQPLRLVGTWPNPFNPQTTIHFDLGRSQRVRVEIYNVSGRRIKLLADEVFPRGEQGVVWTGRDDTGRGVGSGTYFVMVRGDGDTFTQKVTLLK